MTHEDVFWWFLTRRASVGDVVHRQAGPTKFRGLQKAPAGLVFPPTGGVGRA